MRPLAAALAALALGACAPGPLPGYRAATPAEHDVLVGVVREYYDIVDRAYVRVTSPRSTRAIRRSRAARTARRASTSRPSPRRARPRWGSGRPPST